MKPRIPGRGRAPSLELAKRRVRDEETGATKIYEDARLYDWEYRRRKRDVAFYRMLADEQGGPIADLGCGSARMMAPLLGDGHRVIGVDRSSSMLARAAARIRRLGTRFAARGTLVFGDLRALPLRGSFPFMLSAFHTIQHLVDDDDLLTFFRQVKSLLTPKGWLAFDVFVPHPSWLAQPANRPFGHTVFRHPTTLQRTEYSVSHFADPERRTLHMRFHYQPLTSRGRPSGPKQIKRLCHRQLGPEDVDTLTAAAGLRVLSRWADFEGLALDMREPHVTEQHIYLVGPQTKPGIRNPLGPQAFVKTIPKRRPKKPTKKRTKTT